MAGRKHFVVVVRTVLLVMGVPPALFYAALALAVTVATTDGSAGSQAAPDPFSVQALTGSAMNGNPVARPFSLEALGQIPGLDREVDVEANLKLGRGYAFGADAAYLAGNPLGPASDAASIDGQTRTKGAVIGLDLERDNLTGAQSSVAILVQKPVYLYDNPVQAPAVAYEKTGHTSPFQQGSETDLGLSYLKRLGADMRYGLTLTRRTDADNINGINDYAALFRFSADF